MVVIASGAGASGGGKGGLRSRAPTVPDHFDELLQRDPFAPAVVLVRPGLRERVWVRAAVEHRAVRVAALAGRLGLPADARVAVQLTGALDTMAAAFFLLATGRVLCPEPTEAFVLDDAAIRLVEARTSPYSLASIVHPDDVALEGPRPMTHRELFVRLRAPVALPNQLLWRGLRALATGQPLLVDGVGTADALASVYAA